MLMENNESLNPYIFTKTTTQFMAKYELLWSRIVGSLMAWFWADLSSLLLKAGR